jgi:hypothetical protein
MKLQTLTWTNATPKHEYWYKNMVLPNYEKSFELSKTLDKFRCLIEGNMCKVLVCLGDPTMFYTYEI